tara:strand:- start:457 stop:1497 length:1041 start_codon:yes stop_codon:yes gene_type:complete
MAADPNAGNTAPKLTKKDFSSDQDVRWCPGCGDYAILAAVQRIMPDLGLPKENIVFVSGIGCSSRFPYYMNTYGFHTIHGRAPAFATGIKLVNPDLSVWLVTGDGDALSIGGNHLLHILRRNPNVNILLFNNRIYGLTKGQFSPTSEVGKNTKSSPWGNIDQPINPISLALGANSTFVARTIDRDPKHMAKILMEAYEHKGTSFVEILQNCNIFNDGAFMDLTERDVKADNQLLLTEGAPLIFGKDKNKGIRMTSSGLPEVVTIGENGISESDIMVHDPTHRNMTYSNMLAQLDIPDFPVPVGVLHRVSNPVYEDNMTAQVTEAQEKAGTGDLQKLVTGKETWVVE